MPYYLYVKTHQITGLKYLGQTSASDPHKYIGSGKYWKPHIRKHGRNFTTEILLITESKKELKETGLFFSNLWNVVEDEDWANLKKEEGEGGFGAINENRAYYNKIVSKANTGRKHTSEARKKISEKAKMRQVSKETCKKMSDSLKGIPKSVEMREKVSNSLKGRIFSEEHKEKLRQARSKQTNPMLGKTHSTESKMRMSKAAKLRAEKKKAEVAAYAS